jgi:hypothetical protein
VLRACCQRAIEAAADRVGVRGGEVLGHRVGGLGVDRALDGRAQRAAGKRGQDGAGDLLGEQPGGALGPAAARLGLPLGQQFRHVAEMPCAKGCVRVYSYRPDAAATAIALRWST